MDNPWQLLHATEPFVLDGDKTAVLHYNKRFPESKSPDTYLHVELLPEPFQGRRDAPIVLLNLNPGFTKSDLQHSRTPHFIELSRQNLIHEALDYPLFYLDPKLQGSGGYYWWGRMLRKWFPSHDQQLIARSFLNIEYFPYKSREFDHRHPFVESQNYGFSLVKEAIERKALIILMRSERLWHRAVPELRTYPGYFKLKNIRRPTISRGNCGDECYDQILAILGSP